MNVLDSKHRAVGVGGPMRAMGRSTSPIQAGAERRGEGRLCPPHYNLPLPEFQIFLRPWDINACSIIISNEWLYVDASWPWKVILQTTQTASLLTAGDAWFFCDLSLKFILTYHQYLEDLHWFEVIFKIFGCAIFEAFEVKGVWCWIF